MVRFTARLVAGLLLAGLDAGASLAGDALQATRLASGLALVEVAGEWRMLAGDASVALSLPSAYHPYDLEAADDGWVLAGSLVTDGRSEIVVFRGTAEGVDRLSLPPSAAGRVRANPALLVENGQLRGLAWVEGDRQQNLTVRAAEWLGDAWSVLETPSGPGPGAQLALSGAVLANGDWLLLWSAFDGTDDEVLWSRRSARGWSAPERLHGDNRVPDVTPVVVADGDGAVAAWSSFDDGHYRLRTGRLGERGWRLADPSGTGVVVPLLFSGPRSPMLLYRTMRPEGWAVRELSDGIGPGRSGFVSSASEPRPQLVATDGAEARLVWEGAQSAAVTWETDR